MSFHYESGERILKGVLYAGWARMVEEVGDSALNPEHWILRDYRGGVMVVEEEPLVFEGCLLPAPRRMRICFGREGVTLCVPI
jgi:hypothetical protein